MQGTQQRHAARAVETVEQTVPVDGSTARGGRVAVVERVTSDLDGYRSTIGGVQLDMVRGGPDHWPSRARCLPGDLGVTVSVAEPGCTTICHTKLEQDRLAVSHVLAAAPGTKWFGDLELTAGLNVTHQPGAEHTAVNQPGTRFVVAIVDVDAVAERSEVLEIPVKPWRPGVVDVLEDRSAGTALMLAHIANDTTDSVPRRLMDDLLTTVTLSLSDPDWDQQVRPGRFVDSRAVVGDCIEFASAVGREPSISEMCLVARVSGRRLRQAFHDTCDVSPRRFFRHWILCEAHDRLLAASFHDTSVTQIATDLGLSHLGRFSVQYRALHGETPSETLARSAAAIGSSSTPA